MMFSSRKTESEYESDSKSVNINKPLELAVTVGVSVGVCEQALTHRILQTLNGEKNWEIHVAIIHAL